MEMESCVPPGFRFHPTEEELVGYYLNRKVNSLKIDLDVITDIDLYRMEPWDMEDKCKLGYEEQNEWYFFSHKDRKYPTGTRTNRATAAGFWKATGRDKAVLSKDRIIGMRKTLVYYRGRAPNGRKSDWIMHEYRLQTCEHGPPQEEGWVVCRAFKKPTPSQKQQSFDHSWNNNNNINPHNIMMRSDISNYKPVPPYPINPPPPFPPHHRDQIHNPFDQNQHVAVLLPKLDSPSISTGFATSVENNEDNVQDEKSSNYVNDHHHHRFNDSWTTLQVLEPSSYDAYTNIPLIPENDDQYLDDDQNHLRLECFPDL